MAKDTFYFSHDYNTRNDIKIKKLISKHGLLGYGVFWSIIEDLYNNANALRTDYDCIAYDLRVDVTIIKSIINDFDLFVFDNEFFGSLSVERRLEERNEKSQKAREIALKRWNKIKDDANALPTHSQRNAIKERKGKEIKGKESKINIPAFDEFLTYALEQKPKVDTNSVKLKFDSWVVNNWKDGNDKPIKNWKSKLNNTLPFLQEVKQVLENKPVKRIVL